MNGRHHLIRQRRGCDAPSLRSDHCENRHASLGHSKEAALQQSHRLTPLPSPKIHLDSPASRLPISRSPFPPPSYPLPPLPPSPRPSEEGEEECLRTSSASVTDRWDTPSMQIRALKDSFETLLTSLDSLSCLPPLRASHDRHQSVSATYDSLESEPTKAIPSEEEHHQAMVVDQARRVSPNANAPNFDTCQISLDINFLSNTPTVDGNNEDVLDLFTTLENKTESLHWNE